MYRAQYEKYLQSLSPEVRRRLEAEDNEKLNGRKRPACPFGDTSLNGGAVAEKRTKPVAAVFIFIEDNKDQYKKSHPDMDDCEIQRQLVKDYNCLEEKDKVKYKQLEEQAKEKLARENSQSNSINPQKKAKLTRFPGEPPLPPHSGYQLFSKELLLQLKNVKSNERLQAIGKRWALLSDADKQRHNRRKDALWTIYRRDVEKFKKTLSPSELRRYEDLHRPCKSKRKKTSQVIESAVDNELSSEEEDEEVEQEEEEEGERDASNDDSVDSSSSDNDEDGSSSSSSGSDTSGSSSEGESEAEEEMGYQLDQHFVPNGNNTQSPIKSGKLSAADVYDESSSSGDENSSEDSDGNSDSDSEA